MAKTVKVIVNADDLGISSEVNSAIFDLVGRNLVTSVTVIGNGPYVEEACQHVDRYPTCSFGAHLNVTQFKPLSGSDKLEPLLAHNGEFDPDKIRQVTIDSSLAEGIFQEFSVQIENLARLGITISHVDSHNYVLSIPRLFPVLKRLQKKYHIRKVRISRNIYARGLVGQDGLTPLTLALDPDSDLGDAPLTLRLKKTLYNFMLRHYYRTKTTQGFSGFRLFYEYSKRKRMNFSSFEAVVHPGSDYYDPGEIEILQTAWQEDLRFPIRLISYHDIK